MKDEHQWDLRPASAAFKTKIVNWKKIKELYEAERKASGIRAEIGLS